MSNSHSFGTVELFCSYSHKDQQLRDQFQAHMAPVRRRQWVQIWTDQRIGPGAEWDLAIDAHLSIADLIVLLISADYLNSDYCYTKEMGSALQRQESKNAYVIPIIVRPCFWQEAPFAMLQVLPLGGKAVTLWKNRDAAWTQVVTSIKMVVLVLAERTKIQLQQALEISGAERQLLPEVGFEAPIKDLLVENEQTILSLRADLAVDCGNEVTNEYRKWDEYIRR